jgi:multifunctional beta-oxidation protein
VIPAAKFALIGLTETLAKEGVKYNITANVLAPGAASRLTETVWPPEMMEIMQPTWVVPLVAVLVHASNKESGSIFEAQAGHFSKIRWERSKGALLKPDVSLTPGGLLKAWDEVKDWTNAEHPNNVR